MFISSIYANAQDTINWQKDYKLKWADFMGIPPTYSEFGAITNVTITYRLKSDANSFSCKVFCFFNKKTSWTKSSDSIGLSHEQDHFNISALFAAKFRKKIQEYKFHPLTVKNDLQRIYSEILKQRDDYNANYDLETHFSRDRKKQAYWSNKIEQELISLKPFINQ